MRSIKLAIKPKVSGRCTAATFTAQLPVPFHLTLSLLSLRVPFKLSLPTALSFAFEYRRMSLQGTGYKELSTA